MLFGVYCEVTIETLQQIKMKYVEDYEGLIHFLTDFHMLQNKPSILAIDSIDHFIEARGPSSQMNKQVRLNFILTLLDQC